MTTLPEPGRVIPTWTLGDRLRKARETTGLEQADFGQLIGVSRATVSNYERGLASKPKRSVVMAWSMATGVPLQWLENEETPGPERPEGEGVRRQGLEPRTR